MRNGLLFTGGPYVIDKIRGYPGILCSGRFRVLLKPRPAKMKGTFAPGVLKGNYPVGLETCGVDQDLGLGSPPRVSFTVTLPT